MSADNKRLDRVLLGSLMALLILPWFRIRSGFFSFDWLGDVFSKQDLWPALGQALIGHWQIIPLLALAALALWLRLARPPSAQRGRALAWIGAAGLLWLTVEGLSLGLRGWNWGLLETTFGAVKGQPAFGAGAVVLSLCFTLMIALSLIHI